MNHKKTKKKINELLEQLEWLFSLQYFEKSVEYAKDDLEQDGSGIACSVLFDEMYQRVTVTIYPAFFEEKLEEQRRHILHEMVHTLTHQSKNLALQLLEGKLVTEKQILNENEKLTSRIAILLDNLLQSKSTYAREAYKKYLT